MSMCDVERRLPHWFGCVGFSLFLLSAPRVLAQSPAPDPNEAAQPAEQPAPTIEPERPEFLPPDRPYPGLRRYYYRGTTGVPRKYPGVLPPYGFPYRYGGYYDDYSAVSGEAFDEGYRQGFRDGRRFEEFERAREFGRASYQDAIEAGLAAFRGGDYGAAARQFLLSVELHNGDPVARIHATHALTAQGRYDAAVPHLRKAIELQPKIVYLPADIRREYGRQQDFDDHLRQLSDAAHTQPNDPELWLLLGYYQFFSDRRDQALASLDQAAALITDDRVIERLREASRASVHPDRELNR